MKTTLDLPDELMREVKIRAVKENRKLKDAIADLLRRGLGTGVRRRPRSRRRCAIGSSSHLSSALTKLDPVRR